MSRTASASLERRNDDHNYVIADATGRGAKRRIKRKPSPRRNTSGPKPKLKPAPTPNRGFANSKLS